MQYIDRKQRRKDFRPSLSAYMLFRAAKVEFLRREELVQRELDGVKDVTWIFVSGSDAFLVGVAEVKGGDQKLNKAYQLYDREYAQSHNNSSLRPYNGVYIASVIIASAVVVFFMYSFNAGIQNQGLGDLNLDNRKVILFDQPSAAIVTSFTGQWYRLVGVNASEDLDLPFGTKEDHCLREPDVTYLRGRIHYVPRNILVAEFAYDTDLIPYIDSKESSLKWNIFKIGQYCHNFSVFCFYLYCVIDKVLYIIYKIYYRIFNAIFFTAIVIYFFYMNTHGFP